MMLYWALFNVFMTNLTICIHLCIGHFGGHIVIFVMTMYIGLFGLIYDIFFEIVDWALWWMQSEIGQKYIRPFVYIWSYFP